MKKIGLIIFMLFSLISYSSVNNLSGLYEELNLMDKIEYNIFLKAMKGYERISDRNSNKLVIIDYTKPSVEKRFYVLDLDKKKILYESLVSHSKNTGVNEAIVFSDIPNSYQSSIGFFLTGSTYSGDFGYSLRLKGLENGINSNAERRKIVIHGASYVSEEFIEQNGFLGRTLGCPALPLNNVTNIIDTIKDGVVIFVAGNDGNYIEKSHFFN